jgi:hypothetical protein
MERLLGLADQLVGEKSAELDFIYRDLVAALPERPCRPELVA